MATSTANDEEAQRRKYPNVLRVQAQGQRGARNRDLQASIVIGSYEPLSKSASNAAVSLLALSIDRREATDRSTQFVEATQYIKGRPAAGVEALFKKSFVVPGTKSQRVDLNIEAGVAFVSGRGGVVVVLSLKPDKTMR